GQYTMQMLVATEYPPGFSSRRFRRYASNKGARSPLGALSVVHAELLTEGVADLAHRAPCSERLAHRRQQVRIAACSLAHALEEGGGFFRVSLFADARRAFKLAPFGFRVDPMQLDLFAVVLDVLVDADDHLPPRLYLLRVGKGGLLDLALHKPLF